MEWPGQVFAWALIGLSAVAAIIYGVRRNRPNAPVAWWFVGAGVLLFIAGDTAYKFWHQILGQQNIPFPSFVDAIYITMYPVLAIGLLLLARSRVPGGDPASLIDALTVTLGVALVSWTFLIGPNVRSTGGMLVRLSGGLPPRRCPAAGHAGRLGAQGDSTTPPAGFSPSAPSGPSPPTPSTASPTSTRH